MEEGRGLNVITIPIIKGKYEELKSQELYKNPCISSPTLTGDFPPYYDPNKTTVTYETTELSKLSK